MRTFTADVDLLAHSQTTGTRVHNWDFHVATLIEGLQSWYSATVGRAQLASLPIRLLSDVLGETAALPAESHLRDGFGRPIY